MKSNTVKIIVTFLFIFVFGILALPQFEVNIFGKDFKFPNIDLTIIDPSSTLGNFKR